MSDYKASQANNFSMVENSMEKMWEMWQVGIGSFARTQEKMGSMARKQLDQSKAVQGDLIKLGEEMNKQLLKNQEQFRNMFKETVTVSSETANKAK